MAHTTPTANEQTIMGQVGAADVGTDCRAGNASEVVASMAGTGPRNARAPVALTEGGSYLLFAGMAQADGAAPPAAGYRFFASDDADLDYVGQGSLGAIAPGPGEVLVGTVHRDGSVGPAVNPYTFHLLDHNNFTAPGVGDFQATFWAVTHYTVPEGFPYLYFVSRAANTKESVGQFPLSGSVGEVGDFKEHECPAGNDASLTDVIGRVFLADALDVPPGTPRDLTVTPQEPGDSLLFVDWTAPLTGTPTGYLVYRDGTQVADVTHPTTQYMDTVPSYREWCYTVNAYNAFGKSANTTSVCATPTPCGLLDACSQVWGGDQVALAESAQISVQALQVVYALLLILGLTVAGFALARVPGAIGGAFAGLAVSLAVGWVPLWAVLLLAVLAGGAFTLVQRGSAS